MAFTPSRSKKAQWDALESYIEKMTSDEPRSAQRILLENIDRSVLLALLTKKRSQLDLVCAETAMLHLSTYDHSKRSPGLQFPDYDFGIPTSEHRHSGQNSSSLTIAIPAPYPVVPQSPNPADFVRRPHRNTITELVSAQRALPSRSDSETGIVQDNKVSPLSPTFGPRRGEVPSGTLARRRASLPLNHFSPSTGAAPKYLADDGERIKAAEQEHNHGNTEAIIGTKEKRIIWEAAWREIEGHLEEYVGRFGEIGDGLGQDAHGEKQSLWDQILDLVEKIRKVQRGSKPS